MRSEAELEGVTLLGNNKTQYKTTYSPEVLEKVLSLGMMVSFCGPATHPNARRIHEAIRHAPVDSILTETDCPDLPPIQADSSESRPWHTRYVLETIASIKRLPEAELAQTIQNNFLKLFTPRHKP